MTEFVFTNAYVWGKAFVYLCLKVYVDVLLVDLKIAVCSVVMLLFVLKTPGAEERPLNAAL